jgi:hypothetical protein
LDNNNILNLYGSTIDNAYSVRGELDCVNSKLGAVNDIIVTYSDTTKDCVLENTARGWLEYVKGKVVGMKFHGFDTMGVIRGDAAYYDTEFPNYWYLNNDRSNTLHFVDCEPPMNYSLVSLGSDVKFSYGFEAVIYYPNGSRVHDNGYTGFNITDKNGNVWHEDVTPNSVGVLPYKNITIWNNTGGLYYMNETNSNNPYTITGWVGDGTGTQWEYEATIEINSPYTTTNPFIIVMSEATSTGTTPTTCNTTPYTRNWNNGWVRNC